MSFLFKIVIAVLLLGFRSGIGFVRAPKSARLARLLQAVKSDLKPNKPRKKRRF